MTIVRRASQWLVLAGVALAATASVSAADQLRSELSLASYTVRVNYDASLSADEPRHRAVIAAGGAPERVRIGQIETDTVLRMGDATIGRPIARFTSFDVTLEAASGQWQLVFAETADPGKEVARVSLNRQDSPVSSHLVAVLVPVTGMRGRILLRWGAYEAGADFVIAAAPRTPQQAGLAAERASQAAQGGRTGAGQAAPAAAAGVGPRLVNRAHDADNSAAGRARILAQRGESALVLSDNRRVSVTFPRSFAKGEPPAPARAGQPRAAAAGGRQPAAAAAARGRGLSVEGPDFGRLLSTADGNVVMLTQGAVPRFISDAPVRFGSTVVPVANQVPGFPGAYGLWLRRAGGGWRLVFNDEPDVWGTQHNPETDRVEIPLQHTEGHDATRPFAVAVAPSGVDRGRLLVIWGPHEWTAEFVIGS